ncbi:MAG: RNA polymerase-binding protein DksA [Alphaproteobacteria bacterium]|nr:RNA polymerase-binding protein DksA [Alphaproteobacteria bacterium]MBE8220538.1 RNA polymerase-binding protein DksA [Alphaproteobacteria bacterium]
MATRLTKNYSPSDDEPFMNARQREYFRRKLQDWKDELVRATRATVEGLQNENIQQPDEADRAALESEKALELRTRDRHRKLINKIDAALERIEQKEYGYCKETGDPISLKRLEARPIATLGIEAQERHEKHERVTAKR